MKYSRKAFNTKKISTKIFLLCEQKKTNTLNHHNQTFPLHQPFDQPPTIPPQGVPLQFHHRHILQACQFVIKQTRHVVPAQIHFQNLLHVAEQSGSDAFDPVPAQIELSEIRHPRECFRMELGYFVVAQVEVCSFSLEVSQGFFRKGFDFVVAEVDGAQERRVVKPSAAPRFYSVEAQRDRFQVGHVVEGAIFDELDQIVRQTQPRQIQTVENPDPHLPQPVEIQMDPPAQTAKGATFHHFHVVVHQLQKRQIRKIARESATQPGKVLAVHVDGVSVAERAEVAGGASSEELVLAEFVFDGEVRGLGAEGEGLGEEEEEEWECFEHCCGGVGWGLGFLGARVEMIERVGLSLFVERKKLVCN